MTFSFNTRLSLTFFSQTKNLKIIKMKFRTKIKFEKIKTKNV